MSVIREPLAAVAAAGETEGSARGAFFGRQPIVDRHQQLLGYGLMHRSEEGGVEHRPADDRQASLPAVAALLRDFGVERVLGGKVGFVRVDMDTCDAASSIGLLDPKHTVLEFPSRCANDADVLARVEALRADGFGIAVAVDSPWVVRQRLFSLATHAKVDLLKVPLEQLPLVVKLIQAAGGRRLLVAEKVETREQAETCLRLGFDCLQGYYFARPELLSERKLVPARAAVMQAIKLLLRNADIVEVDAAIKRDVGLSVKLLRYMNSAGMGLSTQIDSLKQAIALLGYQKLARWLTLLLAATDGRDPTAPLLARTAITRGRLLELIGEGRFDLAQRDNLFITGTFSLLPAMLLMPMDRALEELALPPAVSDVLLHRKGEFAPLLRLAEACEDPSLAGVSPLCKELGIAPKALMLAQLQASDWVAQLGL